MQHEGEPIRPGTGAAPPGGPEAPHAWLVVPGPESDPPNGPGTVPAPNPARWPGLAPPGLIDRGISPDSEEFVRAMDA